MSRAWREPYDGRRHRDKMGDLGRDAFVVARSSAGDSLRPRWTYFVAVAGFTFQFLSLQQVRACLRFYRNNNPGPSRMPIGGADHWEVQAWHERLPARLRHHSKRAQVARALQDALRTFVTASSGPPNRRKGLTSRRGNAGRAHR
jgi:hypothetical protein